MFIKTSVLFYVFFVKSNNLYRLILVLWVLTKGQPYKVVDLFSTFYPRFELRVDLAFYL